MNKLEITFDNPHFIPVIVAYISSLLRNGAKDTDDLIVELRALQQKAHEYQVANNIVL